MIQNLIMAMEKTCPRRTYIFCINFVFQRKNNRGVIRNILTNFLYHMFPQTHSYLDEVDFYCQNIVYDEFGETSLLTTNIFTF